MLEKIILLIILVVAVFYIVYTLFFNKKRDCGCNGCDKAKSKPTDKPKH